jgi:hypothetical protein
MKVSDDIMVNNNGYTTPSNSGTYMGTVTSQDSRAPSNPTANVQQNIETNKNNDIKTENKQYKTNTNMNKKQIRLTESDLRRIVKESVKRVLKESIDDKLQFIIDTVKDLGQVQLSDKCGKYYALVDNGDSVVALKFVGANGYGTVALEKLKPQVLDAIYNDLYEDFGD